MIKLPAIHGYIERRILINYTVDPDVVRKILPEPFRPKIFEDKAIVGICLIRLAHIKPKGFPDFLGVSSENGAHRIAVEWEEEGQTREGVYVPRRDTSLKLNSLIGGRIFPGKHYLAKFDVQENDGSYHVGFVSSDDTCITIDAREVEEFDQRSIFKTLDNVSSFFEKGSVGYSPNGNTYEGLKLKVYNWKVIPLEVIRVKSTFFEDETVFPKGSVQFDNALLMTNIEHEWHGVANKQSHPASAQ